MKKELNPCEQVNNKETHLEIEVELATAEEFEYEEYITSEVFEHREVVQRLSVAFMFDNTFKACEDRSKWFGPDGISKQIKKALNINH